MLFISNLITACMAAGILVIVFLYLIEKAKNLQAPPVIYAVCIVIPIWVIGLLGIVSIFFAVFAALFGDDFDWWWFYIPEIIEDFIDL